jgi:hypothetical protein
MSHGPQGGTSSHKEGVVHGCPAGEPCAFPARKGLVRNNRMACRNSLARLAYNSAIHETGVLKSLIGTSRIPGGGSPMTGAGPLNGVIGKSKGMSNTPADTASACISWATRHEP